MKPDYEQIDALRHSAIYTRRVHRENRPMLSLAWHYHPEIEICYTTRSVGKRYVGNDISEYVKGDLVMFGPYLPHGFTTEVECDQIVIQFKEEFLGNMIYKLSEFKQIRLLFENAGMGLQFHGEVKEAAATYIHNVISSDGINRLIHLLQLLSHLAAANDFNTICSKAYSANLSTHQLGKMKKVLSFIEHNFKKDITISDAAAVINLTDSAFYKFIKRHSKKKFTHILNEYRVNYASKRLADSTLTIAEICFESGFKNKSYFNRKFKEILKISPSEFRAQYN